MPHENEPLQPFNPDTMSGIFPGTRSAIYQRVRLRSLDPPGVHWFQLLWYRDPPVALLIKRAPEAAPPLVRLPDPLATPDLQVQLADAVTHAGFQLMACGTCAHWQPGALTSDDGLRLGRCRWRAAIDESDQMPNSVPDDVPDALGLQACLALDCPHFAYAGNGVTAQPDAEPDSEPADKPGARPYVPKSAELDPDRLPFWRRQWHRLRFKFKSAAQPDHAPDHAIIERSGVGAGTEPCFVCQGRIANLGALAVESPEGDKQTLSVWRCRTCHTTYFNDWIDRWERLDSLETEERYFRIAPAEALAALTLIRGVAGGDHPGGRQQRHALRSRLLALVAQREPLSHQVRQGR